MVLLPKLSATPSTARREPPKLDYARFGEPLGTVPLPDHYRVVNRRLRHSAPLTRVRGTSLEKTLINRFFFTHPGGEGY